MPRLSRPQAAQQHQTRLRSLRQLVENLVPFPAQQRPVESQTPPGERQLVATLHLEFPMLGTLTQPITISLLEVREEQAGVPLPVRRVAIKSSLKLSPTPATQLLTPRVTE